MSFVLPEPCSCLISDPIPSLHIDNCEEFPNNNHLLSLLEECFLREEMDFARKDCDLQNGGKRVHENRE